MRSHKCPICNGAGKQAHFRILVPRGSAGFEQDWVFLPCYSCRGTGVRACNETTDTVCGDLVGGRR